MAKLKHKKQKFLNGRYNIIQKFKKPKVFEMVSEIVEFEVLWPFKYFVIFLVSIWSFSMEMLKQFAMQDLKTFFF